jgi:hypothetical protein
VTKRKIEKLTPEQERRIVEFRQKWLDIGLCCDPADFETGDEVIRGFYARIGKPEPLILHFSSPMMSELAANVVNGLLKKPANQLWDQLWDQLWGQLRAQLGDQLGAQLEALFYRNSFWGQHEAYWQAFYLFGHEIGVTYRDEDIALLLEWGRLSNSVGWWAPFEGVCFVSDRPREVHFDAERRLHCEDGLAVRYSDGWGVAAWHGVRVPAEWVECRDTIDPAEILKAENVEQRAAGAAIVGWQRMMDTLDCKVIDSDPDPDHGDLIEMTMPGLSEPGRFLRAYCKRNGLIVEGVPRVSDIDGKAINTVRAAQAWSFGKAEADFSYPDHVS